MKDCLIDGCERKHEARGYCKRHYRALLYHGDPLHVEEQQAKRQEKQRQMLDGPVKQKRTHTSREGVCTVEGYGAPIKAKRLCERHYARVLRTGTLEKKTIDKEDIPWCLAVGCMRPTKTRGYCQQHYSQILRAGSPHSPYIIRLCGIDGCNNSHLARGLCSTHYNQWLKKLEPYGLTPEDVTLPKPLRQ